MCAVTNSTKFETRKLYCEQMKLLTQNTLTVQIEYISTPVDVITRNNPANKKTTNLLKL